MTGNTHPLLISSSPKWVTTTKTRPYRPDFQTSFNNLTVSGSHTKVSIDYWSMEGAVESGKRAVDTLLKRVTGSSDITLFSHNSPWFLLPFNLIDDVIYAQGIPNVSDVTIWLLILVVCIILFT